MQAPEYLTRRELADQLNIYFLGPVQSGRWPKTHSRLFADVQQLGKQEFEAYKESITVDSIVKPWRARTKLRAKKLAAMGKKYRDEGIRERGWRLNIEPEVFQRFSAEVICPECRSRLWESDFNAAVDDLEPFAEALKRRRLKRTACECPEHMGSNIYEPGINMIFSDRAEEAIKHVPPLRIKKTKRNQQDKEEPDRVYGLKQAGDFNFVLNSAAKSDPSKRLRDTIEISPFFEEREPLLFPFLIMEAKSSKQGDPAAVELQSAFCIRRLLLLQHNLKEKTGQETQWKTGPLVWFFHCYGERWTVTGCFVENVNGDAHYSIVDLWSGDIRNEDGAIQLLLIVDYIFDWARDIYRRSILNELNILASDDIADMVSVPDIYSTIERSLSARVDEAGRESSTQDSNVLYKEEEATDSISKSLILIHPEGVVRDASIIESKFLALHITEDDVESFLLSFSTTESSYKVIHIILQFMQDAWRLDAGTLHDLKAHWTSDDSNEQTDRGYFDSQEIFYARIVILMHIGPEWQP
ncbi:hypothetical protein ZTR_03545 [Talaromyces verruculosus]|nr:hypothetical protein ZTR_03545 [Talaromyces verruculosus]